MNKVVVITGTSSGIGKETAKLFESKGDIVYGLSRRTTGETFNELICDITNLDSIKLAIDKVIEEQGRIDVLVNNAGMGISGPVETTKVEEAKRLFNVNFFGTLSMIQQVLPYMRKKHSGMIINISSVASPIAIPFQSFYSASKAAVDSLTFALRAEVSDFGIKVANVLPGDTKTGFTASREKQNDEEAKDYATKMARSVSQMEKDEQNGMNALKVAEVIYKVSGRKNPPIYTTVGFQYKVLVCLSKILPKKLVNKIIKGMYAK